MSSPEPAASGTRPALLAPPFARRMWPLAALAGMVFGVVLPAVYQTLAFRERGREAQMWAGDVARRLETVAQDRPALWAYDLPRLREATAEVTSTPVRARVQVDAHREAMFVSGDGGVGRVEVSAWAPVRVDGRIAGRVQVRLSAEHLREASMRLWAAALLGGALLAAALFFLPLATVRRGDARDLALWRRLEEANATLEARVVERTLDLRAREAELTALGARLVAVQEEERARISRDLHDDLGQVLTGLRLRLTTLSSVLAPGHPGHVHLDAALSAVDEGVEQVRHIAHRLRPAALDGLGTRAALRAHAERWSRDSGLELVVTLPEVEPPGHVGEVLFRVAQEALTNVTRHAEARRVTVSLLPFDDGWRLVVEDDGKGIPAAPAEGRRGLGLLGARERVEQAGGYLDVEAAEPRGTRVLAWHP